MPVVGTKGAMSSQGFGEFARASGPANYIEDVFSTYLYTGNGTSQTITNNIDLSTKGGMTWIKSRSNAASNAVFDTVRGANVEIQTNTTNPNDVGTQYLTAFTTSGFSVGSGARVNTSAWTYASWTFRKQPKFFDVVTWTGDDTGPRNIAHNLGSAPACMLIKVTNTTGNWFVYHSGLNAGTTPEQYYITLNSTSAQTYTGSATWNGTAPTASVFSIGNAINTAPNTYVAYLFASNAGGFGLTGSDNVITCGSMTTSSLTGKATVTLGYEPQFVITKGASTTGNWIVNDNMRGMPSTDSVTAQLYPNLTNAEASGTTGVTINSTGFSFNSGIGGTAYDFIYIAIRRGPMKVPTDATKVFSPITSSATTGTALTTGFPVDMQLAGSRTLADADGNWSFDDRLRGVSTNSTAFGNYLLSTSTAAETAGGNNKTLFWNSTGFQMPSYFANFSTIYWNFRRAPSFFDEVCYTGTGTSAAQVTHNLGVSPNLIIVKRRSSAGTDWCVYCSSLSDYSSLNLNNANNATVGSSPPYNLFGTNAQQTSTYFTLGGSANITFYNTTGATYVAYLFATCAGVSKVGSYTGTGTTKQVDCGFTAGARFVLIKRTDSTGGWYVWDSARGIVAGNDPYVLLNSTAIEVTNTDYVDTYSAGFEISSTAPTTINASGGTYIFLAIA